ncbi:hypothetical protein ABH944_003017 [Caballeronia udeis]|uniref:Type III restriction enzyme, res subunit n=1 Tax=Caballeronia udeis TaxID=1232866 RepID=A0ABW8MGT3_9BURK
MDYKTEEAKIEREFIRNRRRVTADIGIDMPVTAKSRNTYNPFVTAPPLDNLTVVHTCNAYPGTGKTYYARQRMKDVLSSEKPHDTILIYAAPTLLLLYQQLEDMFNDLKHGIGDLLKKIHIVVNKKNAKLKENAPAKGPAQAYIKSLIDCIPENPADIRTRDQLEKLLSGPGALPGGHVILTTHETIVNIPPVDWKARCSLIFDEARSCLIENETIMIPRELQEYLRSRCDVKPHPGGEFLNWRRFHTSIDDPKCGELINKHLPLSTLNRNGQHRRENVLQFIASIQNDLIDVWTDMGTTDELGNLWINLMLCPSNVFYGWGKVLCLSAFFERSQMGRALKRLEAETETTALGSDWYRVKLIDVTDTVVERNRKQEAQKRVRQATITYIHEDRTLSKTAIAYGAVIPASTSVETISHAHKQWNKIYRRLRDEGALTPNVKLTPYRIINPPPDPDAKQTLAELELSSVLDALRPNKLGVAGHMAVQALRLSEEWYRRGGAEPKPLLYAFNASDLVQRKRSVVEAYNIKNIINRGRNHPRGIFPPKLTLNGINRYSRLRSAAFLASLALTPTETALFEVIYPDYNCEIDRTVDNCIQFLWRINVRDASSSAPCLFIVSDRKVAEAVNEQLGGILKIVPPQSIVADWKPCKIEIFDAPITQERQRMKDRRYYDKNREMHKAKVSLNRAKKTLLEKPGDPVWLASKKRYEDTIARLLNPSQRESYEED